MFLDTSKAALVTVMCEMLFCSFEEAVEVIARAEELDYARNEARKEVSK